VTILLAENMLINYTLSLLRQHRAT